MLLFFFDDDPGNDGSGSGSSGTCPFSFCKKIVGRVSGSNYVVRVSGSNYVGRVSGIFSFSRVTYSVGCVRGIFSVSRVTESFSRSKILVVSNSEFVIWSLNAFASLTLPAVTSSQPCLDASQSDLSVDPSNMVAGAKADLSLSAMLVGNSPKSNKFGLSPRA